MADDKQVPTVDDLQKTVAQLTAERDKLKTDLAAAQSYRTQFDELKVKYDSVVQTNMDLIRHIPMDGQDRKQETKKDLDDMTEDERYQYLKALAVQSFEKSDTKT